MLIVRKLLLLVASGVLCLGAAELWFRSQTPLELGYQYREGIFRQPVESPTDNRSNKWGMHDLEPRQKAEGTIRVVLLGDSYVASRTVELEQTVGRRLEYHLNSAGNGQYDVVSLGQVGWGQRQQLSELKKRGAFLQPDIVVTLFLSLNDVRNNHPGLQAQGLKQLRQMRQFRPGWSHFSKEKAPIFWFEGSALNRTVSYRLAVLLQRRTDPQIPIDYFVFSEDYDRKWDDAWRLTEGLLRQTSEKARELGARYFVVSASTPQGVQGAEEGLRLLTSAYPAMRSRSWDLDKPDKKLAGIAEALNSPFLALEPAMRQLTRETGVRLHWKYNGHWNREGNDAAGHAIAEFIHARTLSSD